MNVKKDLCIFFSLFLSGWVFAQNQEITSWVGIQVLDRQNHPVSDLKPEDLVLQVNKVQQPIAELAPSQQGQFVILMDLAFSSPQAIETVRKAVWNFLSSIDQKDVAALAVYDAQNFVRLQCNFTSDRNQWAHALNHLDRSLEGEDAAGFYFAADARQTFQEDFSDWSTTQADLLKVMGTTPKDKDKLSKAEDQFTGKITEFAKALNVVRGEKQVLFFSPGIPSRKALPQEEQEGEERDLGSVINLPMSGDVTELPQSGGRAASPSAVQFLAENFSGTNCVVYTFDLSTLGQPVATGKDFLKALAKQTNGTYFEQMQNGLEEVKNMSTMSYLVGWRTTIGPPQYQDVKFTSSQNFQIVAPPKLLSSKSLLQFTNLEKKLYFAHWIHTDSPTKNLQQEHLIDCFPLENQLVRTVLFLQIPGPQLLEYKAKTRSLYIAGYLMQPDGKLVDYVYTPIRVDTDKTFDSLKKAGIKYVDALISLPGEYQFRGVLVDVEKNEPTVLNIPITVPDFQGLTVTSPVVASTNPDWIVLRHEYKGEMKRNMNVRYPYEGQKGVFFPELTPRLQNGPAYFLSYSIYNLAVDAQKRPAPQFHFSLQPAQGQGKPITEIVLAERKTLSESNYLLMFQFKLPQVSPGNYQLLTDLTDTLANKKITRQISVEVQ